MAADAKKAALAAEAAAAQAEAAALLERRQAEHGALIAEVQRTIPPEPDVSGGAEGGAVLKLSFEVPDGRRIVRRFSAATPMSTLYSWAFLQIASTTLDVDAARLAIMTWLPRRVFPNAPQVTLGEAGIVNLMKLFIVIRRPRTAMSKSRSAPPAQPVQTPPRLPIKLCPPRPHCQG